MILSYFLLVYQAIVCNADWVGSGGNVANTRVSDDVSINSTTIDFLVVKCRVDYPTGISSSPTIIDDVAYFPTWNGSLVALNTRTCSILWSINVTQIIYEASNDYSGIVEPSPEAVSIVPAVSTSSPQFLSGTLFFATMLSALVVAVNARDGAVQYITQIDQHPFTVITQSPGFYDGSGGRNPDQSGPAHLLVLVGTDSMEQAAAEKIPGYKCCSFVGRMTALAYNGDTLTTLWNISMIPDSLAAKGWSGVPIYGSQPATNFEEQATHSHDLFIATGNAYKAPKSVKQCYRAIWNSSNVWEDPCLPSTVYADSVMHLNVDTGEVVWVRQLTPLNARAAVCGDPMHAESRYPGYEPLNSSLCIKAPSVNADAGFGMAPSVVNAGSNTPGQQNANPDVVVVGQKNGNLYCFAYDTGETLWANNVGIYGAPAEITGGIAIDDQRVYYTQQWHAKNAQQTAHGSAYGAADLLTGRTRWIVPTLFDAAAYNPPTIVGDLMLTGYYARGGGKGNNGASYGWNIPSVPVKVGANSPGATGLGWNATSWNSTSSPTNATRPGGAGGVGGFIALDKTTGEVLKELELESVFSGGIAVDNGQIVFGSGDCWPDQAGSIYVAQVA